LLEHLKNNPTDPLTREPLTAKDLRPNVALRQVLEEFWMTAGTWAIDW
jgi:STIP1 family protein 1